jgi:dTDP-glucose 4,6-dehydratase
VNWKEKRVLVTGAGGFIGSHLAERLSRAGAKTRCLVHYNALGRLGWLEDSPLRSDLEILHGDITDPDCVREAVKGVDVVFHLAALIAIPYSYHAPYSYVRTNVEGTLNVLQAVRHQGVERFIHTSTSEVYGTARQVPIKEEHPLQGQSPYSASKIGADKMVEAFGCSFDVPVTIARPFNTFGPRQSTRAIIPTIITQCLKGDSIKLGHLHPTRDLNFVSNTVDAFVATAESSKAIGRTVHFGSGREITIGDLAQTIARLMNKNVRIETEAARLRPENSEVERLLADNSLAQQLLGWTPKVQLEAGLQQTIDWITHNLSRFHSTGYVL